MVLSGLGLSATAEVRGALSMVCRCVPRSLDLDLQAAGPSRCKPPPSGLLLKGSALRSKDQGIK